ncbi:amidase signature domain-containing protein [Trichoderma barbatum]
MALKSFNLLIRPLTTFNNFLNQVNKHNRNGLNLGALISVAPREQLLARAQFLDQERAAGKARSPLHGIPFIVKDAIATDPQLGMDTTAGSWAIVGSRPPGNAPTVQKLLDAGGILIGKASLTEFNNFKGQYLIDGWSPVNGYTRSAYVRGPLKLDEGAMGHSSVSLLGSASCLSVWKPTDRSYPQPPVPRFSYEADYWDRFHGLDHLQATGLNHDEKRRILMTQKWDGLRIRFVDEKIWKLPEDLCKNDDEALFQMRKENHSVKKIISNAGVHVEYPVQLPPGDNVWPGIGDIISYEFQQVFNHYLDTLGSSQVRNLKELIDWNRQHADRDLPKEHPSQSSLENSLQCNISAAGNAETLTFLRKLAGPDGIDQILNLFKLDAVASLADSPFERCFCSR